jgi:hypothetical protein
MKDIDSAFINSWEKLLGHLNESERNAPGLALHKLRESFTQLNSRYHEYKESQKKLHQASENYAEPCFTQCQENLVNKLQGFHQQVYVSLSTMILVGNFLGVRGKKQHPINSVEGFLKFLKSSDKNNLYLHKIIDKLLESVRYRSKFIDHPQQNKLHNWMTFGYENEYFVIYYIPKGREVYMIDNIHPRDSGFKPPVNCDEFLVNPNEDEIYEMVFDLGEYLFNFKF